MHVFISYAREDRHHAETLRHRLEEAGLVVWMDDRIREASVWSDEIDRKIRTAHAVVVVATGYTRKSEYVTYEWSYAMGQGNIPVIPAIMGACELHPQLKRREGTVVDGECDELIRRLKQSLIDFRHFELPEGGGSVAERAKRKIASPHPAERKEALASLKAAEDDASADALFECFHHEIPQMRYEAKLALAHRGDRRAVVPLVSEIKARGFDETNHEAIWMLAEKNPAVRPELVELITPLTAKDGKPDLRREALYSLGRVGDPGALDPLVEAMRDGDTVDAAATAICWIGERDPVPEPFLSRVTELLGDESAYRRFGALLALGRWGPELSETVLDHVVSLLRDPVEVELANSLCPSSVRGAARDTLIRLPAFCASLPRLVELYDGASRETRLLILDLLRHLRVTHRVDVEEAARNAMEDDDSEIREAAREALGLR